jgi:2-keto-4-pentenoate hydratase/2-oxohepta-3-ene-1,7-dioic acid hydratase in catechol pathway
MQLFDSDRGVLRRSGDAYEVLDGLDDLHALVVEGRLEAARTAASTGKVALDEVALRAPVRPARLFQVGLNYASHLAEIGRDAPESPMYALTEVTDQVSGPGATITFPADDQDQVDYESEIAVVVGAAAHQVPAADAWSVVAGVCACNDVSARGLQRAGFATGDLAAGKMLTGFKPLGPGLLTTDEVVDQPIGLSLTLNGEVRQQASSAEMVFSIPTLIEVISAEHELVPGDVIMTGSPAGVGIFTGRFLQPGDVVEVTCGDLPPLRNRFAAP